MALLLTTTLAPTGTQFLMLAENEYLLQGRSLYAEELAPGARAKDPAFAWSVGVWMSALCAGARHDPEAKVALEGYVKAVESYWNPAPPVAGFDVLPTPKPMDRYYDDNAWLVMSYAEAAEVLKSPRCLDWAKRSLKYVMSGEDDKLGGGIYWRETDRGTTKNTCSNAPSAAANLAVYRATKERSHLDAAIRLYEWTYKTLRDPADDLYWDNIRMDGTIEKTKWSYNTALMLRTAAELFEITKDRKYADQALAMERSATAYWFDEAKATLKDEGKFGHLLVEAFVVRKRLVPGGDDRAITLSRKVLDKLTADVLQNKWAPQRWDQDKPQPAPMLIDQGAFARAKILLDDLR